MKQESWTQAIKGCRWTFDKEAYSWYSRLFKWVTEEVRTWSDITHTISPCSWRRVRVDFLGWWDWGGFSPCVCARVWDAHLYFCIFPSWNLMCTALLYTYGALTIIFSFIRLTSAYTIGSHFYKNTPGVCVHWTQTRSDRYRPSQWGAPLGKSQLACFLLHVSKVSFSPQGIYYFSNFK